MLHRPRQTQRPRRAVAAAELAVLLPLLSFLLVIGVDFARIFYHSLTITNCARSGAMYATSDPSHATDTTGIQTAALADASNLQPTPTVSSTSTKDSQGNPCVQVTVTYQFSTITNYPGISNPVVISRTVQMRVAPLVPNNS